MSFRSSVAWVSMHAYFRVVVLSVSFRCTESVRGVVSTSIGDSSDVDAEYKANATGTTKEITFMRHAESAGNQGKSNPFLYLYENNFDIWAYRDGRLTEDGEQHVVARVVEMDLDLQNRIRQAELLMVSPLQRTMATAIIMLTTVFGREEIPLRIKIDANLREKVASGSDIPLDDDNEVKAYLLDVANKCSQRVFGENNKYREFVLNMFYKYVDEKRRTDNFSHDVPSDASSIMRSITRFKSTVRADAAERVVVIGHNGWSRWAFAAGLPFPSDRDAAHDTNAMRLIFGARMVKPLCNVGVLTAKMNGVSGLFEDVELLEASSPELQCSGKGKLALLSDMAEAAAANLFPQGAQLRRFVMLKQQDLGGFEERLMTLSTGGGETYLAWADKMGNPKKYIDLSWWNVKATFDDETKSVQMESMHSDKIEAMSYSGEKGRSNAFVLKAQDEQAYLIFKGTFQAYTRVANAHLVDVITATLKTTRESSRDGE